MSRYYDTIDHHALCLNEFISNIFQQNSSYYHLTATMLELQREPFQTFVVNSLVTRKKFLTVIQDSLFRLKTFDIIQNDLFLFLSKIFFAKKSL